MSGRRSRSRSPRRRSSPDRQRRRSDGESYESRQNDRDRNRTGSSSDQRSQHHRGDREERHRSPGHSRDHSDSKSRDTTSLSTDRGVGLNHQKDRPGYKTTTQESGTDRSRRGEEVSSRDQENRRDKDGAKRVEGVARGCGHEEPQREKNVLFPSGSNSVNRGRDRAGNRSWRDEREVRRQPRGRSEGIMARGRSEGIMARGRSEGIMARGRSEGILARENMEETGERRLFEALVDPREVPRSGDYFEHDDRNSANVTTTRVISRQERTFRSPERWSRGRVRTRPSFRGGDRLRERGQRLSRDRERRWSPPGRLPRDRERGRSPQRRPRDRERRDRGGMRSDWSERRHSGVRDRSPIHWKHDLFETVNQSPEPEQQEQQDTEQEPKTRVRSKSFEEGIEDFNIDDLLLMENPIEKMELEV